MTYCACSVEEMHSFAPLFACQTQPVTACGSAILQIRYAHNAMIGRAQTSLAERSEI